MKPADFDYDLPADQIAQYPPAARSDEERYRLLLERLAGAPDPAQRRARFRCVVAIAIL